MRIIWFVSESFCTVIVWCYREWWWWQRKEDASTKEQIAHRFGFAVHRENEQNGIERILIETKTKYDKQIEINLVAPNKMCASSGLLCAQCKPNTVYVNERQCRHKCICTIYLHVLGIKYKNQMLPFVYDKHDHIVNRPQ